MLINQLKIGELYMNDPLKLELCLNFWLADTEMGTSINGVYQKPTQKQVIPIIIFVN